MEMESTPAQFQQREVSRYDEHMLSRDIDAYLLGSELPSPRLLHPFWDYIHIALLLPRDQQSREEFRNFLQRLLTGYRETRLRPFLERSELVGELAAIPEETFRERLLRFRCYLAEPDEPSEGLLSKLRLVIQTAHTLTHFLGGRCSLLELKRALRPLRKSLAVHAPELHTLLYDIAEQMSLVGENSPEDAQTLQQETTQRCREWLDRLLAYYYALLG
ncbi:MAG: hypothetical protein NZM28_04140 [Fimbriimonadales bacterium]|nr:hypothetical protein [Fimbriimonadales bacterium]